MCKVNLDVEYDQHRGKIGVGVIIMDHEAQVLGTLCEWRCLTNSPFTTKALVLIMAAQFCKDVGIDHFILEGGALQVVNL